jgi:hypothetical protein
MSGDAKVTGIKLTKIRSRVSGYSAVATVLASCMWFFRFQNWRSPTPEMSTMLLDCDTGVPGCGRSTLTAEHSGSTNRVKFS